MNADQIFHIQITDPDGKQRTTPVRGTLTIGRQVGNDLLLSDQRISRQHAAIACDDAGCHITDLGSSNGTLLDGVKLPPNVETQLVPGAHCQIGPFELTLIAEPVSPHPAAAPEERPAEPVPAVGPAPAEVAESEEAPPAEVEQVRVQPDVGFPSPPPPPAAAPPATVPDGMIPPGLSLESRRLIGYLPGIYHTDFMARFLGIFEAILTPIEWNIDNFDLFLDPGTAPAGFLPWLASWFDVAFDPSWSESKRRQLLRAAHEIYARRGTKWALRRVLEIYTGQTPSIIDTDGSLEPFTFKVILPLSAARSEREMIERLIDAHKPAYTMYTLEFAP